MNGIKLTKINENSTETRWQVSQTKSGQLFGEIYLDKVETAEVGKKIFRYQIRNLVGFHKYGNQGIAVRNLIADFPRYQ